MAGYRGAEKKKIWISCECLEFRILVVSSFGKNHTKHWHQTKPKGGSPRTAIIDAETCAPAECQEGVGRWGVHKGKGGWSDRYIKCMKISIQLKAKKRNERVAWDGRTNWSFSHDWQTAAVTAKCFWPFYFSFSLRFRCQADGTKLNNFYGDAPWRRGSEMWMPWVKRLNCSGKVNSGYAKPPKRKLFSWNVCMRKALRRHEEICIITGNNFVCLSACPERPYEIASDPGYWPCFWSRSNSPENDVLA